MDTKKLALAIFNALKKQGIAGDPYIMGDSACLHDVCVDGYVNLLELSKDIIENLAKE